MRVPLFTLGVAMLVASPALALAVTNLDTVPHRITYASTGGEQQFSLLPDATLRINGQPNGRLSLASSPAPRSGGAVNSDGILSGYIGQGRDQQIPVDVMDAYVIWPGGDLRLQRRMKRYGAH